MDNDKIVSYLRTAITQLENFGGYNTACALENVDRAMEIADPYLQIQIGSLISTHMLGKLPNALTIIYVKSELQNIVNKLLIQSLAVSNEIKQNLEEYNTTQIDITPMNSSNKVFMANKQISHKPIKIEQPKEESHIFGEIKPRNIEI